MEQPRLLNEAKRREEIKEYLSRLLTEYFRVNGEKITILEAGCGRRMNLDLSGLNFHLVGLDISPEALKLRIQNERDLDMAVVGDVGGMAFSGNVFDVIYCSYLLEHVRNVKGILDDFVCWLKPGGVIIIIFPVRDSAAGWITRKTPFRAHVAYKKYIRRFKKAGEPGYGPFPTVYDPILTLPGIREYCSTRGLQIAGCYADPLPLKTFFGPAAPLVRLVLNFIKALSGDTLRTDYGGLACVIKKP